jgi:signal transduction histidine kinase
LAIVKSIINANGGQISVISQLNHGTTFIIELPIVNTKLTNR